MLNDHMRNVFFFHENVEEIEVNNSYWLLIDCSNWIAETSVNLLIWLIVYERIVRNTCVLI